MDAKAMLDAINAKMNNGSCQSSASLGECAAITAQDGDQSVGNRYYTAHLYLHGDANTLSSIKVARWFHDLGAKEVTIVAVLYDPENNIRNGCSVDDLVRPWDVTYRMPS